MGTFLDQRDDALNLIGECETETGSGLFVPVARTERLGFSGRMEADRHPKSRLPAQALSYDGPVDHQSRIAQAFGSTSCQFGRLRLGECRGRIRRFDAVPEIGDEIELLFDRELGKVGRTDAHGSTPMVRQNYITLTRPLDVG